MENILAFLISPGPEILRIGPLELRWYGILIATSLLIGLNLSNNLAKKRGLKKSILNDLMPILVLASIFGARAYYVSFEWRNYSGLNFWSYVNFLGLQIPIPRLIEIWGGGIAIHGALIGGAISVIIFCKLKREKILDVLDVLVPSVALGQAIGRWGNFFNNEAFGIPASIPWKLFIPLDSRPLVFAKENYFHPTFLYESIWNFLVFSLLILLFQLHSRGKINSASGTLTFIYLISYSFGRFWIELLRIDPLCINAIPPFCEGGIRTAQLISIILFILGIAGLWLIYHKQQKVTPKQIRLHSKT